MNYALNIITKILINLQNNKLKVQTLIEALIRSSDSSATSEKFNYLILCLNLILYHNIIIILSSGLLRDGSTKYVQTNETESSLLSIFTLIFQLIANKISLTLLERLQHATASNLEHQHKSDLCNKNMINSNVNDLNTL